MIQTMDTVMQLSKGSYFSVAAGSRHRWPILGYRERHNERELCFTCFKVKCKKNIYKGLQISR